MAIIAVLKGLKWRLVRHNSSLLCILQIYVSEAYRYLDNNLTKALISGIEILSCYAITLIKLDDS
jgi:hypothetical protein